MVYDYVDRIASVGYKNKDSIFMVNHHRIPNFGLFQERKVNPEFKPNFLTKSDQNFQLADNLGILTLCQNCTPLKTFNF